MCLDSSKNASRNASQAKTKGYQASKNGQEQKYAAPTKNPVKVNKYPRGKPRKLKGKTSAVAGLKKKINRINR